MKKLLIAALVGLLPGTAMAQTMPVAETVSTEAAHPATGVAMFVGGVGGLLLADYFLGRPLTGFLISAPRVAPRVAGAAGARAVAAAPPRMTVATLPPALRAAQDAGGTIGELIKPLAEYADARVRRDLINAVWLTIGGGIGMFAGNTVAKIYYPDQD